MLSFYTILHHTEIQTTLSLCHCVIGLSPTLLSNTIITRRQIKFTKLPVMLLKVTTLVLVGKETDFNLLSGELKPDFIGVILSY